MTPRIAAVLFAGMCVSPFASGADDAAAFGALPFMYSAELSADGGKLVGVGPGTGAATVAFVMDLSGKDEGKPHLVMRVDGQPMRINQCNWSAMDRVVCTASGMTQINGVLAPVRRNIAADLDGGNAITLGQADTNRQLRTRQYDGTIIDWRDGLDGTVLMSRTNEPEFGTGTRLARSAEGLSVELVDTRKGKVTAVEKPREGVRAYATDGRGSVRLMSTMRYIDGRMTGEVTHFYRSAGDRDWKRLGANDSSGTGMRPLAVDPIADVAYVLQRLNGRLALYRIALDGSLKSEVAFASPEADVDDVVRMGRNGRVVGVEWTTDRRQVQYFDPTYQKIAATLAQALPELPLIHFLSASADEKKLLVYAGSDVDPGHLYFYDIEKKSLSEVYPWRPALEKKALSPTQAITYPAADGARVPAYLTLPPGVTQARGLPAIVMPHGGLRDEWGFDWMVQYFAQQGFAVLQPNFRGSASRGDQWFLQNGFKGWKTAIGDVCDAGRWLVAQGMADPAKLAAFGWSYGGYAALQANVLAPDLFKAVVAVAPVTDMDMLKSEAENYTSSEIVKAAIGDGPYISEGSPARHAEAFKAPVLLFHGDKDISVGVEQSRRMDARLREAGKTSELVVYPNLEHNLQDSAARADLLRKSGEFLRRNLGM